MTHRVLVAGLFHETHTFLAETTALGAFQERLGRELCDARGDGSPLAGVIEVAEARGWQVVPTIDLRATPSGTVDDAVFARFWSEFAAVAALELQRGTIDGICLVLHGAMVTRSCDDVEGEIIDRIRALPGGDAVPICGVLDLHGNISQRTIERTQGLVAYRFNPHTDACEAARRGAELLDRILVTGRKPTSHWARAAIVWPPTGTGTADDPMRTLTAMAREIEAGDPAIACVNVFGGFSFADTPDTGVSFSITTFGDPEVAQTHLRRLVEWATEHREQGLVVPPELAEVMPLVLEHVAAGETPVILVEPADNVGGGAPGDTTDLLRAFIEHAITGSVVVINDPAAVAIAQRIGVGGECELSIGAKLSTRFCEPVVAHVRVLSLSDGRFELEDHHSHLASMCGIHIEMGASAVVQAGCARVLLTTHKTPPFDLGQLRSQGIDPARCSVIGVKAAVAHRRAYDPITRATYTVDTAGPCSSDLRKFAFRKTTRDEARSAK